ncbi:MAG: peptidoglycan-binding protein [Leptolyngbya sp. RL_3_1]|nr:peptidoglycan-binding protein [Leptolyngbya sp. RL_3_1]
MFQQLLDDLAGIKRHRENYHADYMHLNRGVPFVGLKPAQSMAYRVALLALTSIAALGLPLGEPASVRADQRSATFAQATRPATSPSPSAVGTEEQSGTSAATPASPPLPSQETEALQQQLSRLGYYQGVIDGVYGPETGEAVSVFQRDVGLATTGLPDPLTLQRLQGTENPLGIVPEAPQSDSDSPGLSATDDATLTELPDDSNDSISTPVDQGAGEAEPLTAETAANPTEAEAAPDAASDNDGGGGWMRLAFSGHGDRGHGYSRDSGVLVSPSAFDPAPFGARSGAA